MFNSTRRQWLCGVMASLGPLAIGRNAGQAFAQLDKPLLVDHTKVPNQPARLALVVGNGQYPPPFDLPSVNAGATRFADALRLLGFDVELALNLRVEDMRAQVQAFQTKVASLPSGSVSLVYFAGHGAQFESNNLLIGTGAHLARGLEAIQSESVTLQIELIEQYPHRSDCLSILLIDACRTDIEQSLKKRNGLNQVKAPPGCVVCFSTKAGRPALAPINPEVPPFFTAALINQLPNTSSQISFRHWLQATKFSVFEQMSNHPVPAIRALAQDPFIADNAQIDVLLNWRQPSSDYQNEADQAAWQAVDSSTWPIDVLKALITYEREYPDGLYIKLVPIYRKGAKLALSALRKRQVKLYRSSFALPEEAKDKPQLEDLRRAARGDKDAAERIAGYYQGVSDSLFKVEGWLTYASALGNGVAAYQLARFYEANGQPQLASAARYQALELGYVAPPTLSHRR